MLCPTYVTEKRGGPQVGWMAGRLSVQSREVGWGNCDEIKTSKLLLDKDKKNSEGAEEYISRAFKAQK